MHPHRHRQRGFQIAELVVALALLALVVGLALPPLLRASAGLRLRLAAGELTGVLRQARATAIAKSAHVAVKFRTAGDGRVTYTLYRDTNGNGVLNREIDDGVDVRLGRSRTLGHLGRRVRLGFPAGRPLRDPAGRPLTGLDDPVRFNRSDLASFGPLGTSTPGSLYLTGGGDHFAVVRVFGRTGKVKTLLYDFAEGRWR